MIYLNRFTQPDSIIADPGNTLDWDRYSYVRNNPTRYTDSSGHCADGITTLPCIAAVAVFLAVYYVAYDSYVKAGGPEAVASGITEIADLGSEQAITFLERI